MSTNLAKASSNLEGTDIPKDAIAVKLDAIARMLATPCLSAGLAFAYLNGLSNS